MCLNTVLLVQTSSGNLQRTAVIQEVLDVLLCSVCRAHSFSFVPWSSFHRRKPKSNSRLKSGHFTALQATDQHNVTILCVITFIFSHVQQRRNFRRLVLLLCHAVALSWWGFLILQWNMMNLTQGHFLFELCSVCLCSVPLDVRTATELQLVFHDIKSC